MVGDPAGTRGRLRATSSRLPDLPSLLSPLSLPRSSRDVRREVCALVLVSGALPEDERPLSGERNNHVGIVLDDSAACVADGVKNKACPPRAVRLAAQSHPLSSHRAGYLWDAGFFEFCAAALDRAIKCSLHDEADLCPIHPRVPGRLRGLADPPQRAKCLRFLTFAAHAARSDTHICDLMRRRLRTNRWSSSDLRMCSVRCADDCLEANVRVTDPLVWRKLLPKAILRPAVRKDVVLQALSPCAAPTLEASNDRTMVTCNRCATDHALGEHRRGDLFECGRMHPRKDSNDSREDAVNAHLSCKASKCAVTLD